MFVRDNVTNGLRIFTQIRVFTNTIKRREGEREREKIETKVKICVFQPLNVINKIYNIICRARRTRLLFLW